MYFAKKNYHFNLPVNATHFKVFKIKSILFSLVNERVTNG